MMSLTKKFADLYLTDVKYPTKFEAQNEKWNVSGILKNRSNEHLKFDTRAMEKSANFNDDRIEKKLDAKSKADKVLVSDENHFFLFDTKEFYSYMKTNKLTGVHIATLKKELEWNIMLPINERNNIK